MPPPVPAPRTNLRARLTLAQQGHYHKGLMSHAEAMLEDDSVVSSLSVEELHTLIDAFNNLGMVGPGVSAAAARLGREIPTIKQD
jgi:hypothetical protein